MSGWQTQTRNEASVSDWKANSEHNMMLPFGCVFPGDSGLSTTREGIASRNWKSYFHQDLQRHGGIKWRECCKIPVAPCIILAGQIGLPSLPIGTWHRKYSLEKVLLPQLPGKGVVASLCPHLTSPYCLRPEFSRRHQQAAWEDPREAGSDMRRKKIFLWNMCGNGLWEHFARWRGVYNFRWGMCLLTRVFLVVLFKGISIIH